MGDLTRNFSLAEFACPCDKGCETRIDPRFIYKLQAARDVYGQAMTITSGYRCVGYNALVGGEADSAHVKGCGADIACTSSRDRWLLLKSLVPYFNRVGIYDKHLHVDDDSDKPQFVIWVGLSK